MDPAKKKKIIKITAIGFTFIGLIVTVVSLYFYFKKDDSNSNGNGNKPDTLKSRIALETNAAKNRAITITSNNAQLNANATESEQEMEAIIEDSADNEDTLNSAIALVDAAEAEGGLDPLVADAVATMETQVEESNLLSEEVVLANLEIQEVIAETEDSTDIIEEFVVEHMEERPQSTELATNSDRISNSTHQNNADNVNRNEPAPANAVGEEMSVNAMELASNQGVTDSENDKTNSAIRTMNKNQNEQVGFALTGTVNQKIEVKPILESSTRVSKMKLMQSRIAQRNMKTEARIQRRRQRFASSPKLNEKQKAMEERLAEKVKEREAKMARIEEKLKQKREVRYTRQQAKERIKEIRQSKIAEIKSRMETKKRNINKLNSLIYSIVSGNGDSEGQYEELKITMLEINPDYEIANAIGINTNINTNVPSNDPETVYEIGNQVNAPTTNSSVEPFRYIN